VLSKCEYSGYDSSGSEQLKMRFCEVLPMSATRFSSTIMRLSPRLVDRTRHKHDLVQVMYVSSNNLASRQRSFPFVYKYIRSLLTWSVTRDCRLKSHACISPIEISLLSFLHIVYGGLVISKVRRDENMRGLSSFQNQQRRNAWTLPCVCRV
jgi:hypothetical protein